VASKFSARGSLWKLVSLWKSFVSDVENSGRFPSPRSLQVQSTTHSAWWPDERKTVSLNQKTPFPHLGREVVNKGDLFHIWTWLDNRNRVREGLALIYSYRLFIFISVVNSIVSHFHSSNPEKTITQWQATTPVNEDMVAPTVAPMAVHHRRPTRHPSVATICR